MGTMETDRITLKARGCFLRRGKYTERHFLVLSNRGIEDDVLEIHQCDIQSLNQTNYIFIENSGSILGRATR